MLNQLAAVISTAGGGGTSYESIATVTLSTTATDVTFSSIPSTFQHLQIRYLARNNTAAVASRVLYMQFNGNTSAGSYNAHELFGTGTGVTASNSFTGAGACYVGRISAAAVASNIFGVGIIDIHDYASTTKNKTVRTINGLNDNGANTEYIQLISSLFINTGAVSSIRLFPSSDSFIAGSTFALYGIKG